MEKLIVQIVEMSRCAYTLIFNPKNQKMCVIKHEAHFFGSRMAETSDWFDYTEEVLEFAKKNADKAFKNANGYPCYCILPKHK